MSEPARWLVDGMNVVGARPDGWWRDRRGAVKRIARLLEAFAESTGDEVTVVFDGRPVAVEAEWVTVAFAPGPGPDAADREIAARVSGDAEPESLRVVTSDADLAAAVRAAGAEVAPAGAFRRMLEVEN